MAIDTLEKDLKQWLERTGHRLDYLQDSRGVGVREAAKQLKVPAAEILAMREKLLQKRR